MSTICVNCQFIVINVIKGKNPPKALCSRCTSWFICLFCVTWKWLWLLPWAQSQASLLDTRRRTLPDSAARGWGDATVVSARGTCTAGQNWKCSPIIATANVRFFPNRLFGRICLSHRCLAPLFHSEPLLLSALPAPGSVREIWREQLRVWLHSHRLLRRELHCPWVPECVLHILLGFITFEGIWNILFVHKMGRLGW